MKAAACEAYQASDVMYCGRCGMQWDVNDPDPPRCGKEGIGARREHLDRLRRRFEVHAVKAGVSLARNGDEYMAAETRIAWKFFKMAFELATRDHAGAAV